MSETIFWKEKRIYSENLCLRFDCTQITSTFSQQELIVFRTFFFFYIFPFSPILLSIFFSSSASYFYPAVAFSSFAKIKLMFDSTCTEKWRKKIYWTRVACTTQCAYSSCKTLSHLSHSCHLGLLVDSLLSFYALWFRFHFGTSEYRCARYYYKLTEHRKI